MLFTDAQVSVRRGSALVQSLVIDAVEDSVTVDDYVKILIYASVFVMLSVFDQVHGGAARDQTR
jgi:hypothetical protein